MKLIKWLDKDKTDYIISAIGNELPDIWIERPVEDYEEVFNYENV
jgi:hypothetical protein